MPIKWSAVKVSENVDELGQLVDALGMTLDLIREKARDIKRIPGLPGYIDQPTNTLAWKVDNFQDYLKDYIERIRNAIPGGAVEVERERDRHGNQQSLI